MSTLQETVHREMVRHLVSKAITCPLTGAVLDVRSCVVLVDSDGDPVYVMSQTAWTLLTPEQVAALQAKGFVVDPATVRP
jgi:hypothetical protein